MQLKLPIETEVFYREGSAGAVGECDCGKDGYQKYRVFLLPNGKN